MRLIQLKKFYAESFIEKNPENSGQVIELRELIVETVI